MDQDKYKTIKAPVSGLHREKGSRFLSFAHPVAVDLEVDQLLENYRKEHPKARHHCYAWRLGKGAQDYRYNDDGEPSGTAGLPIYNQLRSFGLSDILVVVIRYFGGRLLGAGGLARAYGISAADALSKAEITWEVLEEFYKVIFPYDQTNAINKLINHTGGRKSEEVFGKNVHCTIAWPESKVENALQSFKTLQKQIDQELEIRKIVPKPKAL